MSSAEDPSFYSDGVSAGFPSPACAGKRGEEHGCARDRHSDRREGSNCLENKAERQPGTGLHDTMLDASSSECTTFPLKT